MFDLLFYLVGFAGLSSFVATAKRLRVFNRFQRLFKFQYSEPLDVVLTTDWNSIHRANSYSILDDVKTQLGYIRGLAYLTSVVTATRASKPIVVHISEGLDQRLEGDLVLLGGSGGNFLVQRFLEYLATETDGQIGYDENDQEANRAHLGDVEVSFNWKKWSESGGNLTDFALVVMWVNPFTFHRRRALWCAGFTAAGTAVAAAYVRDSLSERWKLAKRKINKANGDRKFPCFALLLAIEFKDESDFKVSELKWMTLPVPHVPFAGVDVGDRGNFWSIQRRP